MTDLAALPDEGRILDAMIAEKVMGWRWRRPNPVREGYVCYSGLFPGSAPRDARIEVDADDAMLAKCVMIDSNIPRYSTDISDAWKVVERLTAMHPSTAPERWYVKVWNCYEFRREPAAWVCTIHDAGENNKYVESGDSPAHAICLAALKAVELSPPRVPENKDGK